jgi:hypothetical protein
MIVAVASDQNPPMQIPRIARATINMGKLAASAISIDDASISADKPIRT